VKDLPKIYHPFVVELWYAIAGICKATYWTRTWIVQETILARTLLLFFGSTKVLSSTCFKWCDTIKQAVVRDANIRFANMRFDDAKMQADLLESSRAISRSTAYYLLFTKAKLGTNMTPKLRLCELLASYKNQKCFDPGDKVYGMLSVASDCQNTRADYSKTRSDLFFEMSRFHGNDAQFACDLQQSLRLTHDELVRGSSVRTKIDFYKFSLWPCRLVQGLLASKVVSFRGSSRGQFQQFVLIGLADVDKEMYRPSDKWNKKPPISKQCYIQSWAFVVTSNDTQTGDVVMRFRDTAVYFVCRPTGERLERLGRAYLLGIFSPFFFTLNTLPARPSTSIGECSTTSSTCRFFLFLASRKNITPQCSVKMHSNRAMNA
jgi:hypothetical protein